MLFIQDIHSLTEITECVILKAILRWINHDKASREKHLEKLLKTVRWAKIKERGDEYKSILENTEWKTVIDKTRKQSLKNKKLKMSRGHIDVMVVVGAGPRSVKMVHSVLLNLLLVPIDCVNFPPISWLIFCLLRIM